MALYLSFGTLAGRRGNGDWLWLLIFCGIIYEEVGTGMKGLKPLQLHHHPKSPPLPPKDRTGAKKGPSHKMSSAPFKLPSFTGDKPEEEDPRRYLRLLEYSFAPHASRYESQGLNLDTAKAIYLGSETSSTAQKWVHTQDDDVMDNWALIKRRVY